MEHIETLEDLEKFLDLKLAFYEEVPRIDHAGIRISQACDNIARHIKNGDREAASIGYQLIVKDPHLPFGKLIKSGIARALKQRVELISAIERDALVGKTTELLSLQFCPRETEDYCKLIKRFGLAAAQNVIGNARVKNEKSKRLLDYMGRVF
jgi:hypothetical protein